MPEPIQSAEPLVTECDCGHTVTSEGLGTGYAREADTDRLICYDCAAQIDREYAKTMKPSDPALFVYVRKAPLYQSDSRIEVTTWPGRKLGYGYMGPVQHVRGGKMRSVSAIIEGREFYGRHYPDAGNYARLHPYKNQPA